MRPSASLGQRLTSALQGLLPRDARAFAVLAISTVGLGLLMWRAPDLFPLTTMVVPLAVSHLVLGPRHLPWFITIVLLTLVAVVPQRLPLSAHTAVELMILIGLVLLVLVAGLRRSRLGVTGLRGESMLVDLRDRILRQGGIPKLPPNWYVASELRSAGGTLFAGDFVVTARKGDRLDVAVVDVSGKGEGAGTRALLLSGALGGLLGALPPRDFLASANDFLMRQDWEEGFASAVHLSLDLATGGYEIRSAGHPPAALRAAGSGRWSVIEAEGPVLGLIDDATYEPVGGTLRSGDVLLLYTDGMVETPRRDISLGVDKMLGQAEQLLRGKFDGGATRIIESIGSRNDDRALLLVHRR